MTLLFQPVQKIRSFVLALTQRLHSAELERRSLVTKACHWEHEASGLKGAYKQTLELGKKVEELEGKVRVVIYHSQPLPTTADPLSIKISLNSGQLFSMSGM